MYKVSASDSILSRHMFCTSCTSVVNVTTDVHHYVLLIFLDAWMLGAAYTKERSGLLIVN